MIASKENRIIESKENLKFVEIAGPNLQQLANKLKVDLPEEWQTENIIFIGSETRLHYKTIAEALGLDPENLKDQQIEALVAAKYTNAGHLVNMGGKSHLVGTSITLSNIQGVRFASLEGTNEKNDLDKATCQRLNKIYAGTWQFIV